MEAPAPEITIRQYKRQATARRYREDLAPDCPLHMVEIPAGSFLMGSPEDEEDRIEDEGPQHEVTVSRFFLGMYPVTQQQWRIVAGWSQVERELDPSPSQFEGEDRPVEQISWYDTVEFCNRLARRTGREYRLPSEAEWEYACRANTTTPFHFGMTITTDLANYRGTDDKPFIGKGSYGSGPKGIYRKETTPVGHFGVANGFGLYDMHGNVWEWCADPWHENYEGAPKDGTIWEEGGIKEERTNRLLRGGSWFFAPGYCRSACRAHNAPVNRDDSLGFRVCCGSPR